MTSAVLTASALGVALLASPVIAASPGDARLRDVAYDPNAVVNVPVKRGVVTLIVLGVDEAISEIAAGLGGDCAKPESAWCIAAQPGGRTVFIKPKSSASAANTLAVVTDQRVHNFKFSLLSDDNPKPPVFRLVVRAPAKLDPVERTARRAVLPALPILTLPPPAPSREQLVAERLLAKPSVMNTQYSLAEGRGSADILPSLVFDDGRFTYLRFPGNREVPGVFQVLSDGSETLVNVRMEDDLLVVDRVSHRLMLRAGSAVVGLWNDAFDGDGSAPLDGTTVPGITRLRRTGAARPVSEEETSR